MSHDPKSESSPSIDVEIGSVLAGKYRVDRVLGVGGMGVVVAATHLELDTLVALKFLLPEVRDNSEVVARFAREARAAAQIRSEYVARTLDVGRLENGSPYIVMEYLDGKDLAELIEKQGPLPIPTAIKLALQACEALTEAHAIGIVHRDLKPSNLFVTRRRDGTEIAKLVDFGISKLMSPVGSRPDLVMTRTSSVMGSPLYMAPEQLMGARNADERSDVWALGVTLYEALAGVPPFNGETLPEVCARVMTQSPQPLVTLRADVPSQLDAVVMRCLQKDPQQRYASAADLAAALRDVTLAPTTEIMAKPPRELLVATASTLDAIPPTIAWPQSPNAVQTARTEHTAEAVRTVQGLQGVPTGQGEQTVGAWGNTKEDVEIPKKSLRTPLLVIAAGGVAAAAIALWQLGPFNKEGSGPASASASASSAMASGTVTAGQLSSVQPIAQADAGNAIVLLPPSPPSSTQQNAGKSAASDRNVPRSTNGSRSPTKARARAPNDLFNDRN